MTATFANCSLTLQRQLMKQRDALKATVDTQVRMYSSQRKKLIKVDSVIKS